jgi:MFS family permease
LDPTPPSQLPRRAWLIVALLWFTAVMNYVDRLVLTTMRSSLKEAIPMTEAEFGLLTTAFLVVYALCSPFAGFLADRVSRAKVITGSLLAWSIVTVATAYATSYPQLLATRIILAVAQAACMPASVALIVDYHRGPTRSIASGLLLSGAMTGGALAGIGGWLAEGPGWTFAYQLLGWIGLIGGGALALLLRDAQPDPSGPVAAAGSARLGEAFRHLLANRAFLLLLVYACALGAVGWAVVGWMPTFMKEQFRLSQAQAGLWTTICLNVAALSGMLVGGAWAGRWGRRQPRACILVSIIGLLLAAPAVLLLAQTPVLALALVGLGTYGFARYFSDANLMPTLCLFVDPRYRATSWGIVTLVGSSVGGLGIYAGGLLRDAQVDVGRVFQFAALNLIVCAAALALLLRQPTRGS